MVKSTGCSPREPIFSSQHPESGSHPFVNLVPRDEGTVHMLHRQKKLTRERENEGEKSLRLRTMHRNYKAKTKLRMCEMILGFHTGHRLFRSGSVLAIGYV